MPLICLVRHGQASFGAADYDALSDLGRDQARIAGAEIVRRGVRDPVIVSGTLRRQRDTAALLGLGAAVTEDARWNEYDHIDLVRRHRERTRRGGSQAWAGEAPSEDVRVFQAHLDEALRAWIETRDAEGWDTFATGAVDALHTVRDGLAGDSSAPTRDAVVVTSGGVIAAVVGSLLGVPAAATVALNRVMVNASITTVLAGPSGLNVLSYNEHAHLAGAGARLRTYR